MEHDHRFAWLALPLARALALQLALFSMLNLLGERVARGFDANVWWIDLSFLQTGCILMLLASSAAAMLIFGLALQIRFMRWFLQLATAGLALAVLANVVMFYRLSWSGRIQPAVWLPLSLFMLGALACIAHGSRLPWRLSQRRQRLAMAGMMFVLPVLFPLAQMYCYGKTDYRRRADAIVVFGARTYATGRPSQALADRTRTAVAMYQQKLAPLLIFSGGPGDGAVSEPQAMRNLALAYGVPPSDIVLDEHGLTTERTVADTVPLFTQRRLKRVIAVSHFYHLPRVKLAYTRALAGADPDVQVLTVPARESRPLPMMPWYLAREVVALWSYYLRPLT